MKGGIMADQFLLDQITVIEEIITSVGTAIKEVLAGGHSSYTLDSGQTVQTVDRLDLPKLRKLYIDFIAERGTIQAACGLTKSITSVRPGF